MQYTTGVVSVRETEQTAQLRRCRGVPYAGPDNISALLAERVASDPNGVVLRIVGTGTADEITGSTLLAMINDAAESIAASINSFGERDGVRVIAVSCSNNLRSIVTVLAVLSLRATAAIIDSREPRARQADRVRAAGAIAWVADGEVMRQDAPADLSPGGYEGALAFFTSGSTGRPKVVLLSHANIIANGAALADHHSLRRREFLGFLPICYANGLHLTVLTNLLFGGHATIVEESDPLVLLRELQSGRYNVASVVPTVLDMVSRRLPRIRLDYFISAAAPLHHTVAARVWSQLEVPIAQGYGLSETTNFITAQPDPSHSDSYGDRIATGAALTVGVPLNGNEVSLYANGRYVSGSIGQRGEVCVRGHAVMLGYRGDPTATAEAFADGWFHTGDIGLMNDEGELILTGRAKNLLKIDGRAISLEEIEAVATSIHEYIADAEAVPVVDQRTGEESYILRVVPRSESLSTRELHRELARMLPQALLPKNVAWVERIARTTNGKLLRSRQGVEFDASRC